MALMTDKGFGRGVLPHQASVVGGTPMLLEGLRSCISREGS